MDHVWWRTHLRRLPELGALERFGNFQQADDWMPFIMESLDPPPYGQVLDLGCGRGSFSVRMAQWGFAVTGVDESAPMLAVAGAAARQRGVELRLRQGELSAIPERAVFDCALILDFGTSADSANAAMVRAVAASLKPGGRVLLGSCNPYYWCGQTRTEHQSVDGMDVVSHYRFDFEAGCLRSRVRCILPDGRRMDLPPAAYRAYTLPELRTLLTAVGLADLRIYGCRDGSAPSLDQTLDPLGVAYLHCVAMKPVTGEGGEGI